MDERRTTRQELKTGVAVSAGKAHRLMLVAEAVRLRLIGMHFETNKNFLLPAAMRGIRAVVDVYREHPGAELLVVGHTDRSGDPGINDPLSIERGEAVAAFLRDDVDAWLARYESNVSGAKRWGAREDRLMLQSLPDASSRPAGSDAVRWFQETRGLGVDGIAGTQTRRRLIAEYMAHDGTTLPPGVRLVTHGCGENFPVDAAGNVETNARDGRADAGDRRVEIFVFDPPGIRPRPAGRNSPPGDPTYLAWLASVTRTEDFRAERARLENSQITYLLRTNSGSLPIRNRPYRLAIAGRVLDGTTDDRGLVAHYQLPAGDFELEIDGVRTTLGTLPQGAEPVPHEVRGYYLSIGS
ncbi:peptidoglycan-binding protein [Candidatus Binatia bacterium]|nr:peptidoglycan-binding protein [Candidatus Binatia bacterium]